MRGHPRLVGRLVVAVAFVVAMLVAVPITTRFFSGIHDVGSLPNRVAVCGRDYTKDALDRRWSWAQVRADVTPAYEPVMVDPGLLARLLVPCQPGACTNDPSDGACATVIWVKVDLDAYIDYSLVGGP
jgi:hypothetical protein